MEEAAISAIATAKEELHILPSEPWVLTAYCDTATNGNYDVEPDEPGYEPQTIPSCEADPADDACVSCAKVSCCGDYQACSADVSCSCLVGCLYQGNTIDVCTSAGNCGTPSGVAVTTAACLNSACPSQCANPGSMGSGMCPGMSTGSSSSSGGGTGPSCTPGPFGSGEPCFSDADCASCICDAQTMACG